MDGEISNVVEMEIKGIYYLIEGTKETIAMLTCGIKAFSDWKHERWLKSAGESSWQKIQEASNGAAPILEFPKELMEPQRKPDGTYGPSVFEAYCEENQLRYCIMPDMNTEDDYIPVAVVDHDISIHQEYIKRAMNERIRRQEDQEFEYEEEIRETEHTANNAETPQEREEAARRLQDLEQARDENHALLEESREKQERDNVLSFEDYLKQAEGTGFEQNAAETLDAYDKVGTVVREFMPYDCMYPIRDAGKIPESRQIFYSQRDSDARIMTIRRDFETDDQGIAYSTYHVFPQNEPGQEIVYTDKDCSKETWKKQLPVMLGQAGMQSDVPTAAVHNQERLTRYINILEAQFLKAPGLVRNAMEQDQNHQRTETEEKKAAEDEGAVTQDTPGDQLTEEIIKTREQEDDYQASMEHVLVIPTEQLLLTDEETVSLEVKEGMIKGINLLQISETEASVRITEEKVYKVFDPEGKEVSQISGMELHTIFSQMQEEKGQMPSISKGIAQGR